MKTMPCFFFRRIAGRPCSPNHPRRSVVGGRSSWYRAILVAFGCLLAVPAFAALQITHLRTEYLENPLGLDTPRPRLSWRVNAAERGQRQTAYRILVASEPSRLASGQGDLWDSGRVSTNETVQIPYGGKALSSGQPVYWKVQVWDRDGRPSEWSPTAHWSMGLLGSEDWKARWITEPDPTPTAWHTNRETLFLPPARYYRKEFRTARRLERAMAYVSALGIYELHVNGRRVGDAFFEPGWADYRRRVHYRTYDVTGLVRRGVNCIGAIVTDGWYAGYVGYGLLVGYGPGKVGRYFYGKNPALLVQLDLEYSDGSRQSVVTDGTWQVSTDGPIREADLIMGEAYDARREDPGWCVVTDRSVRGSRSWRWVAAVPAGGDPIPATFHDTLGPRPVDLGFKRPPLLQAYAAPPIRITQQLKAERLTEPKPGVYLFDLGQNFAGIVRLEVKGAAGTRVQIRYGEMVHPDGRLMTENLRRARATDYYTLSGESGGETWYPRFTYHGFRYVELGGLPSRPDLSAVTGLVLHNDTPMTGEFACSDEVMTRFWKNTQWTQRANFVELPTDCPQRDERLGWMGDAQIYCRTATFNADVASFFGKWLQDVTEAQRESGAYPDYCPYPMAHGAPGQTWGTAWTDAGIICPWTIWRVYGDTRLVERQWPSMERFMAWRQARSPDGRGRSDGNTWGDWLNVDEPTPLEYIDAAYHALDARLMADMAAAIGKNEAATTYARRHEELVEVFRRDYLKEGARLAIDTQTAYALAIAFRLLSDEDVPKAAALLAEKVKKSGVRMTTGFLGTKALLPALTAGGQHDLAVQLFQSRRYPSWGYEVVNGATTVWERWDSYTKEFGFNGADGNQNASMNSFSHYAFGAVMEWGFRNLAGIDALEPGYRRIAIAPRPPTSAEPGPSGPEPLRWVKASYESHRGRIESAWRREADRFVMDVTIPANTTAMVRIPAESPERITEGGRPLSSSPGIQVLEQAEGRVAVAVESGSYRFVSTAPPPPPAPKK